MPPTRRRLAYPLTLALFACAHASPGPASPPADAPARTTPPRLTGTEFPFEVAKSIVYREHTDHTALRLDLYRPECPGPHPVAVVLPATGSGWMFGNRRHPDVRILCTALAREGIAAAGISYRRADHAPHPAQIEDCRDAVRFLRENALDLGIDTTRLATVGASAGGHLAALLGTDARRGDPRPRCVVALSAPLDLTRVEGEEPTGLQLKILSRFLGLGLDDAARLGPDAYLDRLEERARTASPRHFVDAHDPPFLLVHNRFDPVVPTGQARRMHETLRRAGVDSSLLIEPTDGHCGYLLGSAPREWAGPDGPNFWREIRSFLRQHLDLDPAVSPPTSG